MNLLLGKFKGSIESLSAPSDKSFFLSILRLYVAFHIFRDIVAQWGSMEFLLGKDSVYPIDQLSIVVLFARDHYQLFFFVTALLCIFFFFGIGKHISAIFLTIALGIYQDLVPFILNGGDNYLKLILCYLIFADSYNYFSITKLKFNNLELERLSNFVTNLMVYCIIFHLCLIYFISGIEKLHSKEWFNGVAIYYVLRLERFGGTPFNELLASNGWFVNISTYVVLFFELYFPVLIWNKKLKTPLILLGVSMHLGILVFMMLYDFQLLFIVVYGLFITNQQWFSFFRKIQNVFPRLKPQLAARH